MPDRRKIKTERNGGDEDDCDIMALFTSISRRSHSVLTKKKKKKNKLLSGRVRRSTGARVSSV